MELKMTCFTDPLIEDEWWPSKYSVSNTIIGNFVNENGLLDVWKVNNHNKIIYLVKT